MTLAFQLPRAPILLLAFCILGVAPGLEAQDKAATPVDLKAYGLRRLARILPAYYLLLFLLLYNDKQCWEYYTLTLHQILSAHALANHQKK